ncbi:MAG: ribonuclease PH [Firmicutes bacterium]|nr:ribonuclease PH [Bacillota bacterium]MDD4263678.1 ribonuclease PH [Bacillota bacterium]MDD4694252.1 ribonuclease PH [Bacillota bacterium]
MRIDGRTNGQMRQVKITPNFLKNPHGSALVEFGDTKVICTAMVEDKIPTFLRGANQGWLTAEYEMIPGATLQRSVRDASRGKISGRSQEIQRLIGRSMRSITDLSKIGERTVWLDCDVIQADGGTRTASISGAFVALVLALHRFKETIGVEKLPIKSYIGAVSAGIVDEVPVLDLCYLEDSNAIVDMNFVLTSDNEIVEIQGTGEARPFNTDELFKLMELAQKGVQTVFEAQRAVIGDLLDY